MKLWHLLSICVGIVGLKREWRRTGESQIQADVREKQVTGRIPGSRIENYKQQGNLRL